MKKILFLLALLFALNANAQKIIVDETKANGWRLIACDSETFRSMTDRVVLSVYMSALVDPDGQPIYYLNTVLKSNEIISAPPHARLLIKTTTGETISLESSNEDTIEDHIGQLEKAGGVTFKNYSIIIGYKVDLDIVNQLAQQGVAKIRIELNGDKNYEKEWKKDNKMGKFLASEFKLLRETAATDKRGAFEDDF